MGISLCQYEAMHNALKSTAALDTHESTAELGTKFSQPGRPVRLIEAPVSKIPTLDTLGA